jgi:hypothetical protein
MSMSQYLFIAILQYCDQKCLVCNGPKKATILDTLGITVVYSLHTKASPESFRGSWDRQTQSHTSNQLLTLMLELTIVCKVTKKALQLDYIISVRGLAIGK